MHVKAVELLHALCIKDDDDLNASMGQSVMEHHDGAMAGTREGCTWRLSNFCMFTASENDALTAFMGQSVMEHHDGATVGTSEVCLLSMSNLCNPLYQTITQLPLWASQ